MKLVINIHHVSGHRRMFSRSEVKGQGHSETKCPFPAVAYVSTSVYSSPLYSLGEIRGFGGVTSVGLGASSNVFLEHYRYIKL